MRNISKLAHLSEAETLSILCAGNGAVKGVDVTDNRLVHFSAAYRVNVIRGLRINRDNWTMRDNGCGMLSQPVDAASWPICTMEDARFELARHVWCDAVRVSNGGAL